MNLAEQFENLPPHSLEAEKSILGSIFLDSRCLCDVRAKITREDFYQGDHQIVWDVLLGLSDHGQPIDAVMVREALLKRKLLEHIGGAAYLADILNFVPSPAHVMHYTAIVRNAALLRRTIQLCNDGLRQCYAPQQTDAAAGIPAALATELARLACSGAKQEPITLEEAVHAVMNRRDDPKPKRIKTGMVELDNIIGGLCKSRFMLIGGKASMGKSQLAKQIIRNVAGNGVRCGIVTVEENREKIAENYLSQASGIENNKIAFGNLCPEEWDAVYFGATVLAPLPIWIDDASFSLSEIVASIQSLVARNSIDVIAVDHLHLIDGQHEGNREREIAKISAALKTLARKLNIAIVALVQLNRAGAQGERPGLNSLRDSGTLEQDGDTVLLLHREDYYRYKEPGYHPTHELEVIVAKNKDGRVGTAVEHFDGGTQTVRDFKKTQAAA